MSPLATLYQAHAPRVYYTAAQCSRYYTFAKKCDSVRIRKNVQQILS